MVVNAKVQATYDLTKMEVKVDSVKRTIYIDKIPELEINTYPDVHFFDMEQSTFNSFEKDELNEIQNQAVAKIEGSIDK